MMRTLASQIAHEVQIAFEAYSESSNERKDVETLIHLGDGIETDEVVLSLLRRLNDTCSLWDA